MDLDRVRRTLGEAMRELAVGDGDPCERVLRVAPAVLSVEATALGEPARALVQDLQGHLRRHLPNPSPNCCAELARRLREIDAELNPFTRAMG